MENPENPSELEDLKTIYKWIKKNNKFLTLSTFAILFCWYLNPVIRESKFKNMCAYNTTNISLENTDKKNNWKLIFDEKSKKLGKSFGLVDADWNHIKRFCQFYKSSERYIDADIDGSIKTYPYR